MGTIANKLNKIKNTKDKIKTITNLSTVNTITSETVFKNYPKQILKEYVKIINNGTDELYTNFPKVEDEGTKLELDTEKGPLKVTLEGNTSQDGTPTPDAPVPIKVVTGEQNIKIQNQNLLSLPTNATVLGITSTQNSDGSFTLNGTATSAPNYKEFPLDTPVTLEAGIYYLTIINDKLSSNNNVNINFYTGNSNVFDRDFFTIGEHKITITLTETKTIKSFRTYVTTGTSYDNVNIKLMISKTSDSTFVEHQEQNYPISLSSKNLFKAHTNTGTVTGNTVTYTMNNDSSLTINGTATGATWVEILANFINTTSSSTIKYLSLDNTKTYVLKATVLSGTYTGTVRFYAQTNSSGGEVNSYIGNSSSITNSDGLYRAWLRVDNGANFENCKIGIQLKEETTATEYEPYYNIEYCKIGDYADQISNQFESKNLFDYHWFGTSKDILWNYYYESLGQNDFRAIPIYIGIGNYATFSTNVPRTTPSLLYAINDINQGSSDNSPLNSTVVRTIQANSEGYVYLGFVNTRQYYTDVVNGTYYTQIEIGSTVTEYMPYGIIKGEWYLKKNINKVILNGSENWLSVGTFSGFYAYYLTLTNAVNVGQNASPLFKSDRFHYVNGTSQANEGGAYMVAKNYLIFVTETTVSNLKTWMGTNNVILYYQLATPTYIHISQEDYPLLRGQLENLYNNAKSYSGTTIIECSSLMEDNEIVKVSAIALEHID